MNYSFSASNKPQLLNGRLIEIDASVITLICFELIFVAVTVVVL